MLFILIITPIIIAIVTYFLYDHGVFDRLIYQSINSSSEVNGGEIVARVLHTHGVRFLFTLCGGHISPILVAAERLKMRVIDVRNEATAVFAADAMGRLSAAVAHQNKLEQREKNAKNDDHLDDGNSCAAIGVAAVTAGPGVTNAVSAMKNAQLAESPLLLIGGAAASLLRGRGALQDIDQLALFRSIAKRCVRVRRVRDIAPALRSAIQCARSDTPGPVFVELPLDALYPYEAVRSQLGLVERPRTLRQRLLNLYLENYLFNLFSFPSATSCSSSLSSGSDNDSNGSSDAIKWHGIELSPLPLRVPLPSLKLVADLNMMIELAQRPLILLGSQAVSSSSSVSPWELRDALLRLGIPVYLGGMARGLLGPACPLQMCHHRNEALREADLIVLAGTVCDFRLDYGKKLGRAAKIVSINRNATLLRQNSDLFWKASLAIQSDVANTLRLVVSNIDRGVTPGPIKMHADWIATLRGRDAQRDAKIAKMAETSNQNADQQFLNPIQLLRALNGSAPPHESTSNSSKSGEDLIKAAATAQPSQSSVSEEAPLTSDSVLVVDGGDFAATAAYTVRPRGPLSWLDPGPFGTLGVGAGFALAAKLLRPQADVWIVYGDGSVGYSLMEQDTFSRLGLGIISLIGNDACWTQIVRDQEVRFGSRVACDLRHTDYHLAAHALGAQPIVLPAATTAQAGKSNSQSETEAELKEALRCARDLANQNGGQPVVVNCLIGRTNFREGSISV